MKPPEANSKTGKMVFYTDNMRKASAYHEFGYCGRALYRTPEGKWTYWSAGMWNPGTMRVVSDEFALSVLRVSPAKDSRDAMRRFFKSTLLPTTSGG